MPTWSAVSGLFHQTGPVSHSEQRGKHCVYRSGCSHSGTLSIKSMNPIPLRTCISNNNRGNRGERWWGRRWSLTVPTATAWSQTSWVLTGIMANTGIIWLTYSCSWKKLTWCGGVSWSPTKSHGTDYSCSTPAIGHIRSALQLVSEKCF
jgi:hypothetical protein